ncbi:metallopeptidase [Nocardia asteroides]|uniref:metallopeptidase n=1 Tax=Nocardia asteroides TaxID=1824 RepID=UPI001E288F10|nr:metallopeptidase [Nocardia asteroides]UGT60625.1 metallopeptidase [Nocardia asteroides]
MRTTLPRLCAAILATGLLLTGCAGGFTNDKPRAATAAENPWQIAGSTSSTGPSGPRDNVPNSSRTAENGDGGAMDTLAMNALTDVESFWRAEWPKHFDGAFAPVARIISWDATAPKNQAVEFCAEDTYQFVNAAYCGRDHSIGWDRGILLPELVKSFDDMAVVMVLAHEYGHAVQGQAKMSNRATPTLVQEQQADCLAGAFLRYVAEGDSAHFTLNTTDGLNAVLGATVAVRDRDPNDPDNVHGTAFERITAVQVGYTDGVAGCTRIDRAEIEARRGSLPVTFEYGEEEGQLPVDRESLTSMATALGRIMPLSSAPEFDYSGVGRSCAGAVPTEPVSYCPDTDTIGSDVADLAERGGPKPGEDAPLSAIVTGDYNAFVAFVSRYTLAVQRDRGMSLTGAESAGLRTACLSGAVTTALSREGSDPRLSAGDLDEAVSGLLADGFVASDVDGAVVPSGFARLEAFRLGVLDGEQSCYTRFA